MLEQWCGPDRIMARKASIGLESFSLEKNISGYLTHQQINLTHRQTKMMARTGSIIKQIGCSTLSLVQHAIWQIYTVMS